ncbi:MAG: gluconate 2-dehydrogenase subunit 3 family protein [Deltaproteobacteria bacterium]|nr:gluconate 2-dehydrogenase subunit 3 family protein [Deltaproteobacteria bacterium]
MHWLRWNRRVFLRRAIGAILLLTGADILRRIFLPSRIGSRERATLEVVLDTLIPDGYVPGARQTGVLDRLVDECEATRQTRRALVEGVALVERAARRRAALSFEALPISEREAVLAECAAAENESLPWFFFRTVRDRAMRLHYTHPLAWKSVGMSHGPQPGGYPDYEQAPHG